MRGIDLDGFSNVVPLGSGGLGDVYHARRDSTGTSVAIKVLRDWSDRDVAWKRAERELQALVGLRGHSNVVNVEEVVESDGMLAIVMEYAPGGSVSDLARERGGRLDIAEALLVATHTAAALSASHERGIIHRDIKPQNLLIGTFGQVKVCDFGIAALTHSDEVSNRTSSLSLRYASPEELRGDPDVGPAADIYSLAATLHHLLTGTYLPAPDGTAGSRPLRTWIAPDDLDAAVEVELRELMERSANRDPAERPTAVELHDRFDALAARLGPARCRALGPVTPAPGADDVDESDSATVVRTTAGAGEPRIVTSVAAVSAGASAATTPAAESAANTAVRTTAMPVADPQPDEAEEHRRGLLVPAAFVALALVVVAIIVVLTRGGTDDAGTATSPTDSVATSSPTGTGATDSVVEPVAPVTSAPPVSASSVPTGSTVASTAPPSTSTAPTTAPAGTPTTAATAPVEFTTASRVAAFEISAGDRVGGRSFESIDGLTYDASSDRWIAAKEVAPDEIGAADPARAEPAIFALRTDGPVAVAAIGPLIDADGSVYGSELDIEGITLLADGSLVVVSEGSGELGSEGDSFVHRLDDTGRFLSAFEVPDWLTPSADGTSGFQDRRGLHGVATRPGVPDEVVVIVEAPLVQDDPGRLRLTAFDTESGRVTREWSYPVDEATDGGSIPLVVDVTAVADGSLVVLERLPGAGPDRLYRVELDAGDDPGGAAPEPLDKVAIAVDGDDELFAETAWANVAAGPTSPDGRPTITLMNDTVFDGTPTFGLILELD